MERGGTASWMTGLPFPRRLFQEVEVGTDGRRWLLLSKEISTQTRTAAAGIYLQGARVKQGHECDHLRAQVSWHGALWEWRHLRPTEVLTSPASPSFAHPYNRDNDDIVAVCSVCPLLGSSPENRLEYESPTADNLGKRIDTDPTASLLGTGSGKCDSMARALRGPWRRGGSGRCSPEAKHHGTGHGLAGRAGSCVQEADEPVDHFCSCLFSVSRACLWQKHGRHGLAAQDMQAGEADTHEVALVGVFASVLDIAVYGRECK
ncbi:hypothetical protein B0T21DRAFT_445381 [Apiosordaria backusii]|uniref:Uncharacterized protein n=1 Tax=Apiosordaria backusii TaxID=314023 RepID=A0AA40EBH2_9PEZI|nr:hypothetical protein B0T21DRAFT_445381 [Apiosordaria backusii]